MLCAYITTVCVPVYIREISGESKYHVIIIINILSTIVPLVNMLIEYSSKESAGTPTLRMLP